MAGDRMQFDVCVIGGGLWGSAAARHLSTDTDLRVCLLGPEEPNKEDYLEAAVLGSHYDEGRIFRETDPDPTWGTLAQRSIARYQHLEEITGIPFYTEVGCLTMAPIGSNYNASIKGNCVEQRISHQMCGKQELQTFFPYLKPDPRKEHLFTSAQSGHISPRRLVAAQRTAAHIKGCEVVNDIALKVETLLEGSRRNVCIMTERSGNIYASRVLICAGGFINYHRILPGNLELDIDPQSETVMLAEVKGKELAKLRGMPAMIVDSGVMPDIEGCYILPPIEYPNGKSYLKIGHHKPFMRMLETLDDIKQWFASGGDERVGEYLQKLLHDIIDFEESSVEFNGCLTTVTPTTYPYCGMVSSNIGILTGGNGRGAKSSDEIGRMGATLIAKGRWDHDLPEEKFKPRFKLDRCESSKL